METRLKNSYLQRMLADEHDACAIVASIRTSGEATHGNLKRTIEALGQMGHRSGDVQSEGDGCGETVGGAVGVEVTVGAALGVRTTGPASAVTEGVGVAAAAPAPGVAVGDTAAGPDAT